MPKLRQGEGVNNRTDFILRLFGYFILALITYGSIYPFEFGAQASARLPAMFSFGGQITTDIIENILALVPVGAAFAVNRSARIRWYDYGLAGIIVIALQVAQLWMPVRTPAITDAIYNVLGLAIGVCAVVIVRSFVRFTGDRFSTMGIALCGLFLVHLVFVFTIRGGHVGVWEQTRLKWEWLANPFVEPYAALVAGALASAVLFFARPPRNLTLIAAILLGGAIILLALTPWRPGWLPFQWQPFRSLAHGLPYSLAASLCWKLFSYGALAHLLLRLRCSPSSILIAVPGVIFGLELLQIRSGSGSPDITEVFWGLLCAAGVIAEWHSHRDSAPIDKSTERARSEL
jgi:glycopeptide antibiotics resistance protein